jgi:hypothetical protein
MTQRRYLLDGMHPFFQLVLLASLTLIFSVVFMLLGMYLVRPFFGVMAIDTLMQSALENPESVADDVNGLYALKFLQSLASIGTFLIPPLLFAWLKFPGGDYLKVRRSTSVSFVLLGILILLSATPFIDFTYQMNRLLTFPESLSEWEQSMKESSEANEKLTLLFLHAEDLTALLANMIVLAVIPALGEELMFRGAGMPLMREWTKNWHVAIWITAFFFSFVHMDVYGFLPRFLLGVLLGYLFVWTGSLWVPIVAHAFNNGAQVLLVYLHEHGMIDYDIRDESQLPAYVVIIFSVLCIGFIYALRKLVLRRSFIW